MSTTFFCSGDLSQAKVLVIGHDPRLQDSNTLCEFAFFADYFFRPIPTQMSERAKYNLAKAVFDYISNLTSFRYTADHIVLTNLCNNALPHAQKGKTVYIPESEARSGICTIQDILFQSHIEVIFAMSAQVNYWLQKLGFYPAVSEFLSSAVPKAKGVNNTPPYYEAKTGRAFTHICGRRYTNDKNLSIIPILHVKNWPLRRPFALAYSKAYDACISWLKYR